MTVHEASRTLVKSPPELWAELSDASSLASHLAGPFGEIRITRLEPETAVAWEGDRASGTVRLEPSGWGTRVTLTARAVLTPASGSKSRHERTGPEPAPVPPPAPEPLPPAATEPAPTERESAPRPSLRGVFGFLRGWLGTRRSPPAPEAPAQTEPDIAPAPEAPAQAIAPAKVASAAPEIDPDAVLVGVLDRLGAAHRRPFSRS